MIPCIEDDLKLSESFFIASKKIPMTFAEDSNTFLEIKSFLTSFELTTALINLCGIES